MTRSRRAAPARAVRGAGVAHGRRPSRATWARPLGRLGAVLFAAALAFVGVSFGAEKPNVLLVTFDTTRADHVGCYGASFARTPTLDRLAAEGTRFETVFSPAPLTVPAHAALMTGLLPRRHGLRDNQGFSLDRRARTLASRFKAAGYATAAVVGAAVLDRSAGLADGFDVYDDAVREGPRRWFAWRERAASQVVDAAAPLVARAATPLFLWVHFYDPHMPYVPPPPYAASFAARPYDGEIAFADAQLARLLDELKKRGLDRNLIVVVAGDHGESLGEHGEAAHGVFLYQATVRVPLIAWGAGVARGRVERAPVGLEDVAPTIAALAGLPAIDGDGRALFAGRVGAGRDFEIESIYPRTGFGWAPLAALVRWPLKFVLAPRPELYDLAADPRELRDLAARRPAEAATLRRELERRRAGDAPEPAPLDAERAETLRSLGYVGGAAPGGVVAVDPKDGVADLAALDKARALNAAGNGAAAVALLEPIVRRVPAAYEARLALAGAYAAAGNGSAALALCRATASMFPASVDARLALGDLLAEGGAAERSEAEATLRRAAELAPRNADVAAARARLLLRARRPRDAKVLLDETARRGVEDATLELLRGAAAADSGDVAAADRSFAASAALDPEDPAPLEARARLARRQGRPADAATFLREALKRRPSFRAARELGDVLERDLRDREGARGAFAEALRFAASPGEQAEARRRLDALR